VLAVTTLAAPVKLRGVIQERSELFTQHPISSEFSETTAAACKKMVGMGRVQALLHTGYETVINNSYARLKHVYVHTIHSYVHVIIRKQ
jgi:hypothetical protein